MRERVSSLRQRRNADVSRQRIAAGHDVAVRSSGRYDVLLAELTTKARKKLPRQAFAVPERRAYPIHDESHARNALARVAQHGTPEEKSRVRAAVRRRFPGIAQGTKRTKGGK